MQIFIYICTRKQTETLTTKLKIMTYLNQYFHAKSKKEAREIISKTITVNFDVILYKRMSKGNSLYQLILK